MGWASRKPDFTRDWSQCGELIPQTALHFDEQQLRQGSKGCILTMRKNGIKLWKCGQQGNAEKFSSICLKASIPIPLMLPHGMDVPWPQER